MKCGILHTHSNLIQPHRINLVATNFLILYWKEIKAIKSDEQSLTQSVNFFRRVRSREDDAVLTCFFCDGSEGKLHRAATSGIDRNFRTIAFELQDTVLLARLQEGNMFYLTGSWFFLSCLLDHVLHDYLTGCTALVSLFLTIEQCRFL